MSILQIPYKKYWRLNQMTNAHDFSISDRVLHVDSNSEWWVVSLYYEINKVICITTDESRDTRRTFNPNQLEILPSFAE